MRSFINLGFALLVAMGILAISTTAVLAQPNLSCPVMYVNLNSAKSWKAICTNSDENALTILVPSGQSMTNMKLKFNDGATEQPVTDGDVKQTTDAIGGHIELAKLNGYIKTKADGSPLDYHLALYDGVNLIGKIQIAAPAADKKGKGGTVIKDYESFAIANYPGLSKNVPSGKKIRYNSRLNQVIEGSTIHIFVDEKGNLIRSNVPTTATEKNVFEIHVIYQENKSDDIACTYEGDYAPTFEVYGAAANKNSAKSNADNGEKPINEKVFGPFGPFTDQVELKVTVKGASILDKKITIAKLHYIALNAGLYGTSLRNPDNVRIGQLSNGDTTLLADDPTTRGFVTVMLTFYPHPRNLLFPLSNDWRERIAFTVGTSISKKLAENFFGGLSYDVARGLSITGGVHYGRHNVIIDDEHFEFGKDKFTGGTVANKVVQRWDAGFFIGLSLDFRLLTYILNTDATTTK